MDILIVRKRNDGWVAYFHSNQGMWEWGKTKEQAIGKLILNADQPIPMFYVDIKE